MSKTKKDYPKKVRVKNLRHPEKYIGDIKIIELRSSYEESFMRLCDSRKDIIKWNSEEVVIPYISPLDNRKHKYYIDFFIVVKERDGKVGKYLVEVKPEHETREPDIKGKKTKTAVEQMKRWKINSAKWAYTRKFCEKNKIKFKIITEKHLRIR